MCQILQQILCMNKLLLVMVDLFLLVTIKQLQTYQNMTNFLSEVTVFTDRWLGGKGSSYIVEQLHDGTLRPPQDPLRLVPKCAPGYIF